VTIELTHFSIVVLAEANNPSILNPDFLKNNGIVDPSFTPTTVFCTPPVSQVAYSEGISIVAEFEKLQFIDEQSSRIPKASPIPDISSRYVRTLPHVKYTAVGINLSGHRPFETLDAAKSFVMTKFIKPGPWLDVRGQPVAAGVNLVYSLDNLQRTVNVNPGELRKEQAIPVVSVRYNHNYNLQSPSVDDINSLIANWPEAFKYYTDFCEYLFKEK
jgi:hypothetical protein